VQSAEQLPVHDALKVPPQRPLHSPTKLIGVQLATHPPETSTSHVAEADTSMLPHELNEPDASSPKAHSPPSPPD
jgi:hypothetical protein